MKVLYLAPDANLHVNQVGGAGTHIRATLESLRQHHEVVVALGGDLLHVAQQGTVSPPTHPSFTQRLRALIPEGIKKLYRDYLRQRLSEAVYQKVKALIEKTGKPDILYERSGYGYDVGMRLSAEYGIPRCMETDVIMLDLMKPDTSWVFNRWIYRKLEQRKYHSADAITVQSEYSVELCKRYWNLTHDRVFNKDLGITLKKLSPNPDLNLDEEYPLKGKFVVGYVGIFQRFHNIPVMLEAAKYLKEQDIVLMIVGDGVDRQEYEAYVKKHCLDQVIFTGLVPKQDIGSYYQRMDLGLIPGCAYHMYPVKYLELGAMGVPTLSPRYEVFRPFYSREDAYLQHSFVWNDAKHLADQLIALKNQHTQLAEETEQVKAYILSHHTWEQCGLRVIHALEETLRFSQTQHTLAQDPSLALSGRT